jgi:hypothetical protein
MCDLFLVVLVQSISIITIAGRKTTAITSAF